jgi:hypothetical protein
MNTTETTPLAISTLFDRIMPAKRKTTNAGTNRNGAKLLIRARNGGSWGQPIHRTTKPTMLTAYSQQAVTIITLKAFLFVGFTDELNPSPNRCPTEKLSRSAGWAEPPY